MASWKLLFNFFSMQNSYKWMYDAPEVAEAALVRGDRNSFHRCAFLGHQDTLCDYAGRHFYDKCWIEGSVDFIFGYAQSMYTVYIQSLARHIIHSCSFN